MKLRCFYFKRRLATYADGEASRRAAGRIEDHLVDCGDCRATLLRLRAGQQFAGQVPRRSVPPDQWEEIESLIDAEERRVVEPAKVRAASWWRPARVSVAAVLLALVSLSLLVVTVIMNRPSRTDSPGSPSGVLSSLDLSDFHAVSISDIGRNTEPHVVAEGYVSDVRLDREDGDLVFKLVDDVRRPQPFIVCEIINPIKIDPPPVGSHVRVYGVSRYDGKADHQWYEVHPVLDIRVVLR
jgi:anti-sigma factor RsiW